MNLAAEGQLPIAKNRQRLDTITLQNAALAEKHSSTEERLCFGAEQILAFVDLLEHPGELYERMPETLRRDLLLGLFDKLRVFDDADGVGIESDRREMNETLHEWQACHFLASRVTDTNQKKRASRISAGGSLTSTPHLPKRVQ